MDFRRIAKDGVRVALGLAVSASLALGCEESDVEGAGLEVGETQEALGIGLDFENRRIVLEDEFTNDAGQSIRYKQYQRVGREKAYVIFLNGRSEFIEKYDPLFTALYEQSWETEAGETLADLPVTFFAIDHTGQGLSDGLLGHIDDYDTYTANVFGLIRHVRALSKHKKPIILMAHSMGGLIAARFAEQHPEYVDGLVLSSPMFGINPPPGVSAAQLQQLVTAYAAPKPYGFGMADRCARLVDPTVLGMIAMCMTDATGTCQGCFMGDPTQPACAALPYNWAAMGQGFAALNSPDAVGCHNERDPEAACTFPSATFGGTTSDYEYCYWTNSHELAGPEMTFGWLFESYEAIAKLSAPENVAAIRDIPTLVLSTPIDPIVTASAHGPFCELLDDCELVQFNSNFQTGPIYFHELLAETDRASAVAAIRAFIDETL